jgi:hypothetical protein
VYYQIHQINTRAVGRSIPLYTLAAVAVAVAVVYVALLLAYLCLEQRVTNLLS